MCVGVEFQDFNVVLHTKSEQKVIGNQFCSPIIIKYLLKTNCVGRVWIVKGYIFENNLLMDHFHIKQLKGNYICSIIIEKEAF